MSNGVFYSHIMAKITVSKKTDNFVILDKTALNDCTLTWQAKGLHAYLMSLPNDWKVYVSELTKRAKNGKDSVSAILHELMDNGYLLRETLRDKQGKFKGYDYTAFETPQFTEEERTALVQKRREMRAEQESVHEEIEQEMGEEVQENPKIEETECGLSESGKPVFGESVVGEAATTNNTSKEVLIEVSNEMNTHTQISDEEDTTPIELEVKNIILDMILKSTQAKEQFLLAYKMRVKDATMEDVNVLAETVALDTITGLMKAEYLDSIHKVKKHVIENKSRVSFAAKGRMSKYCNSQNKRVSVINMQNGVTETPTSHVKYEIEDKANKNSVNYCPYFDADSEFYIANSVEREKAYDLLIAQKNNYFYNR